jgi:hypothetical protein
MRNFFSLIVFKNVNARLDIYIQFTRVDFAIDQLIMLSYSLPFNDHLSDNIGLIFCLRKKNIYVHVPLNEIIVQLFRFVISVYA